LPIKPQNTHYFSGLNGDAPLGTTFAFKDMQESTTTEEGKSLRMKRILLVEDDAPTRRSLSILLNGAGYSVEEAKDGLEAREKLFASRNNSCPFDLLLTDIFMPRMSGLELIDEIQKQRLALPVLVITAFGDDRMEAQLLRRGCPDLLNKPFGHNELLERVDQALREKKHIQRRI